MLHVKNYYCNIMILLRTDDNDGGITRISKYSARYLTLSLLIISIIGYIFHYISSLHTHTTNVDLFYYPIIPLNNHHQPPPHIWNTILQKGIVGCPLLHILQLSELNIDENDYLHFRSLIHLCQSSYRDQLQAKVLPEYIEQFQRLTDYKGYIENAYVTFMHGNKYMDLGIYSIQSVHEFSTTPVFAFLTESSIPYARKLWNPDQFPQLVIFQMPVGTLHSWFDKLRAILLSPVKHGVIIETDTLITPYADRFFTILNTYNGNYPILPGHPDERLPSCINYHGNRECSNTFPYPAAKRSMPYVHAHVTWITKHKYFIANILETCIEPNQNILDCSSDEAALNYALWNHGATVQYCVIDPYWTSIYLWEHISFTKDPPELSYAWRNRTLAFMLVHGAKKVEDAKTAFEKIKQVKNNPYIVHGGKWTNNVNEKTIDNCLI